MMEESSVGQECGRSKESTKTNRTNNIEWQTHKPKISFRCELLFTVFTCRLQHIMLNILAIMLFFNALYFMLSKHAYYAQNNAQAVIIIMHCEKVKGMSYGSAQSLSLVAIVRQPTDSTFNVASYTEQKLDFISKTHVYMYILNCTHTVLPRYTHELVTSFCYDIYYVIRQIICNYALIMFEA